MASAPSSQPFSSSSVSVPIPELKGPGKALHHPAPAVASRSPRLPACASESGESSSFQRHRAAAHQPRCFPRPVCPSLVPWGGTVSRESGMIDGKMPTASGKGNEDTSNSGAGVHSRPPLKEGAVVGVWSDCCHREAHSPHASLRAHLEAPRARPCGSAVPCRTSRGSEQRPAASL